MTKLSIYVRVRVQWRQNILWNHIEITNVTFNVRNLQLNVTKHSDSTQNLPQFTFNIAICIYSLCYLLC